MGKFKVIAYSVGGHNNKIYYAGDVVDENNFPPGNAKKLVENGFLEPIPDHEKVEVPTMDENPKEENRNFKKKRKKP